MTGEPKIVGFVCDWSVNLTAIVNEQQRMRAIPSVSIIRVPCSGFVRPDWLEDALTRGADGVFVTGCPYGDCVNREGNYLIRDRVDQLQRRLQRRRVDPNRVAMLAYGLHDVDAFVADVRAFAERVARLKPAAPAKAPAVAVAQPSRSNGGGAP